MRNLARRQSSLGSHSPLPRPLRLPNHWNPLALSPPTSVPSGILATALTVQKHSRPWLWMITPASQPTLRAEAPHPHRGRPKESLRTGPRKVLVPVPRNVGLLGVYGTEERAKPGSLRGDTGWRGEGLERRRKEGGEGMGLEKEGEGGRERERKDGKWGIWVFFMN